MPFCLLHIRFWVHDFVSPVLFFSPLGARGAKALPRRVRPAYSRTLCLPYPQVGKPPSPSQKSIPQGRHKRASIALVGLFPTPANKMAHRDSQGQRGVTLVSCCTSKNHLTTWPVGASIRAERKIAAPPLEVYALASTSQLFWSFFIVFSAAIFEWPETS